MEHILKLDATDDITAIRSRIETVLANSPPTEQRRLLLIVPRKNKALRSLVNMKLLGRLGQSRAIEMALVSDHPLVRDYAKEANIKAFGSLWRARLAGWGKEAQKITPPEATAPQPNKPIKRAKKKKYKLVIGSGRVGILQQLGILLLMVGLALAVVVGVITLLPQATVTLTPQAKAVETELIVRADPAATSVDFETLTFPAYAQQVDLSLSGQIETIETELAPVGQATGQLTLINRTPETQTLPISTTVSTSAGEQVQFALVQTATIPAGIGATTATQIIALDPGPVGNLSAGKVNRFVDSSYALVARIINEQPLTGGSMEPAKIVVQDDKERLQAHLRQKVQQEGLNRLQNMLGEQEFIPPETVQVIVLAVTYNEFSGDFSDTFSGEMQAVVRGTVVGGYNANRLALAALEAQVPPGFKLDIEGLHFGAGEVLDVQEGVVTFRIFANGQAVPVLDPYEIAAEIAWLPIGEAQARLRQQYPLATVPGVNVQPDWATEWLGRLPYYPLRIKVVINEPITLVADGN